MACHVISADCHINEPPGTFVDRLPAHLKDRAQTAALVLREGAGFLAGPSAWRERACRRRGSVGVVTSATTRTPWPGLPSRAYQRLGQLLRTIAPDGKL